MKKVERLAGIIVRVDKHKEFDMRLTMFTPTGIQRLYATGLLRPKAKLRGALQLFNLVEVETAGTRITSASVLSNMGGISKDIHRYYLACSICESVAKLVREGCELIFAWTLLALTMLAHAGEGEESAVSCYKIFIAYFAQLLVMLGYDTECNSRKLDEFKDARCSIEIDAVQIGLKEARQCIKALNASFISSLDFAIPHVERFI